MAFSGSDARMDSRDSFGAVVPSVTGSFSSLMSLTTYLIVSPLYTHVKVRYNSCGRGAWNYPCPSRGLKSVCCERYPRPILFSWRFFCPVSFQRTELLL